MVQIFFNTNDDRPLGLSARMSVVLSNIKDMPYAFVLFFLERKRDTDIGNLMRKAEERLLERLKVEFPDMTEDELLRVYLLELGSIAYGLEPERIADIFKR